MLLVHPKTFPDKGFPCLYLFKIKPDIVKIGKTIHLQHRKVSYKGAPCLAYKGPVCNLAMAEKILIQEFREVFPRFTGSEWFDACPEKALEVFSAICKTNSLLIRDLRDMVEASPHTDFDVFSDSLTYDETYKLAFADFADLVSLWNGIKGTKAEMSEAYNVRLVGKRIMGVCKGELEALASDSTFKAFQLKGKGQLINKGFERWRDKREREIRRAGEVFTG